MREIVVGPGARDERVERHVLAVALVDVERMNVELGEHRHATAVDQHETRADQNDSAGHRRHHYLHDDTRCSVLTLPAVSM